MKKFRIHQYLDRLRRQKFRPKKTPVNIKFKKKIQLPKGKYCVPTLWAALLVKGFWFRKRQRVLSSRTYRVPTRFTPGPLHEVTDLVRRPTAVKRCSNHDQLNTTSPWNSNHYGTL